MNTANTSKIAAKIRALIAKAQSSEHEAEAAAFMAKAQELLETHQIDLGTIHDGDDPVKVSSGLERTSKDPTWHKKLYSALGTLYGCKIVYAPKIVRGQWGFAIELTGRESAIVTAELMYPWVKSQCEAEGRRLAKEYPHMTSSQHTRRVANALASRIWRLAAQNKAQAPKTEAAARNALVTVDRVEAVFKAHYGDDLKNARSSAVTTSQAAREAANRIGLHRQTGSTPTLQLSAK